MNDPIGVAIQTYEKSESLLLKSFLRDLEGFAPRSAAHRRLAIRPDISVGKITRLLRGWDLFWSDSATVEEDMAFRKDGHVLSFKMISGHAAFVVFSERFDAASVADELLKRFAPLVLENKEDDGVWVDFSHLCADRVIRTTQFLRCPSWVDVRANYAEPARNEIERLIGLEKPWSRGRLVIWHGPPGTGKTYAIRALMMKWKDRFDFLVVTDPERLAADPGYFLKAAGRPREGPRRPWMDPEEGPDPEDGSGETAKKRVVFILEDTADLILQESRSAHFDKIGKLLNMTDGLFGQGREDLFLLTVNEEVDRIDPAFLRPGRCVANVEFPKFRPVEAAAWLKEHGHPNGVPAGEMTLAEMYARVHEGNREIPPAAPARCGKLGFAASRTGR
jgi:hypothetical protein